MARQVFFDPFGSYTEGFDRGAGRQIQTEGAVRQARQQDYDYNNFLPLRLAAAQREDQLGRTTLPYQEALAPYALDTARANRYDTLNRQATNFAQTFNLPAPLQQLAYQYFGITPTSVDTGNGQPPITQYFMQGANGEQVPVGQAQNPGQGILDYLNWQRNLQSRQLANTQQYQAGVLQNTADRNDAYQRQADARMLGAYSRYYQQQGGFNGNSLFGGSMPTDLTNPGYYQQPGQQGQGQGDLQDYNLGVQ